MTLHGRPGETMATVGFPVSKRRNQIRGRANARPVYLRQLLTVAIVFFLTMQTIGVVQQQDETVYDKDLRISDLPLNLSVSVSHWVRISIQGICGKYFELAVSTEYRGVDHTFEKEIQVGCYLGEGPRASFYLLYFHGPLILQLRVLQPSTTSFTNISAFMRLELTKKAVDWPLSPILDSLLAPVSNMFYLTI